MPAGSRSSNLMIVWRTPCFRLFEPSRTTGWGQTRAHVGRRESRSSSASLCLLVYPWHSLSAERLAVKLRAAVLGRPSASTACSAAHRAPSRCAGLLFSVVLESVASMLNLGPLFERSDQAISPTSPERRIGKGPAPPPHTPTSAVPHGLLQRIGDDRRRSCAETASGSRMR